MQVSRFSAPVGRMRMLASDKGLAAIYFPVQAERIEARLAPGGLRGGHGNIHLLRAEAFLACYFDGDLDYSPMIPLDLRGTPFQVSVWRALADITPGVTESYGSLAARLGRPTAARAVGAAVGRNPIAVLLGCHRVVGARGDLTGYAGGLRAKRYLLDHERRHRSAPSLDPADS